MAHNFSLEHPISKIDATFSSSIRGLIVDVLCQTFPSDPRSAIHPVYTCSSSKIGLTNISYVSCYMEHRFSFCFKYKLKL